jgi:hypothetical protein
MLLLQFSNCLIALPVVATATRLLLATLLLCHRPDCRYRETLLASSFTLAPVGTADDCFRFWEAIEAGSVPVFVRRAPDPCVMPFCALLHVVVVVVVVVAVIRLRL